jgi:hypothetical protein
MIIETISRSPKIFRVKNFFTESESDVLVNTALGLTEDAFRLKRSSTGAVGYNIDTFRTSENAFDTGSPTAMGIKRRGFELLGIAPYDETFADGLQVLRYNQTTAYVQHMDWIEPAPETDHDWDSAGKGSNRYATILLYLSDVEDGGETVFSEVSQPGTEPIPKDKVLNICNLIYKQKYSADHTDENSLPSDTVILCITFKLESPAPI